MEREQTTIRLPSELKEQIQREADEEGYRKNIMKRIRVRCNLNLLL